jgi:hypothetical protein
MTTNVLEIGPGINPCAYAFDSSVNYTGIDPDMHYLVAANYPQLVARIEATRGDMTSFKYEHGRVLADVLDEYDANQDVVVMANVLGDKQSYKSEYSGYFVDPISGATRQTNIQQASELIAQAFGCLKIGGTLVIVENAICSGNELEHKTPEEFTAIIRGDVSLNKMLGAVAVHSGKAYVREMHDLYHHVPDEPVEGYYNACFVAELVRIAD